MMRALGAVVFLLLLARPEPAEACACCDAVTKLVPLGWSQDGKTVLLEESSTVSCQRLHQLVEWASDKPAPEGCYNLLDDPDKRVACADPGDEAPEDAYDRKVKRSKVEKSYAKKPTQLAAANVRVTQKEKQLPPDPANPDADMPRAALVTVEIKAGKGWRQIWSGTVYDIYEGLGAAVWPTPKGDRALVVISYKVYGNGNRAASPHWVSLTTPPPAASPAPPPAPSAPSPAATPKPAAPAAPKPAAAPPPPRTP